jgi:dihydropteroate synthase
MIGQLLDLPVEQRLQPSVALAVLAIWLGARILRVHDVEATVQAVRMCAAVQAID